MKQEIADRLLDAIKGDDEEKAWDGVRKLVNLQPQTESEKKARAYACCCMAEASFARNKIGTAIDWWQEAVDCDPLNPAYRLAFVARGLMPAGLHRQALNECSRAIALDGGNPEAWRLKGHVHYAMGDAEGAIKAFDQQIELAPMSEVSYLDRIDIALDQADWGTADKFTRRIIEMRGSQIGNAMHQAGLMAFRQGRHEEALKIWDNTLMHQCDNREVVFWNQSMALLSLGQYREGWRKHEYRGVQKREALLAIQMHRGMPERIFCNEPPPARLHVHQEMGFGDALAMARYLPLLVERGYQVTFEVMETLVDLMRDSLPGVNVIKQAPIYPGLLGVPEFDYLVPSLSLPYLFETETSTIPWRGPYLNADPKRVEEYRAKLNGRPTIGICWSAGVREDHGLWLNEYGKRKSLRFDQIIPIIQAAGCQAVSLQVGKPRDEGAEWLTDLLPKNPTWADTAALVECLDLVITADTGLAHLVGGMGKPLWLMMHAEGSWHWMAERPGVPWNEKSPWYPSAKLFRQKAPYEWAGVILRIVDELRVRHSLAA